MAAAATSSRLQLDTETRIEIEREEERVRLQWQSQGDRSSSGELSEPLSSHLGQHDQLMYRSCAVDASALPAPRLIAQRPSRVRCSPIARPADCSASLLQLQPTVDRWTGA